MQKKSHKDSSIENGTSRESSAPSQPKTTKQPKTTLNAPTSQGQRPLAMPATLPSTHDGSTLTKADVEAAFAVLSSDGKKITKEDVELFFQDYFPGFQQKLSSSLNIKDIHRETTKDTIMTMLVKRPIANPPYEQVFDLFDPVDDAIHPDTIKKYIKKLSPQGMERKGDYKAFLKAFDKDQDGVLSLSDFKHMTL